MQLICAHCDARTYADAPCSDCGEEPLLHGRYALMAVLGEGASGTTYRARDVGSSDGSGIDVAIKELAFHRVDTFKAQELFEREAAVLCRLDHPGVPQFFDSFAAGEGKSLRFYLVMEFIAGHALEDELDGRQCGPAEAEVLAILEELGTDARSPRRSIRCVRRQKRPPRRPRDRHPAADRHLAADVKAGRGSGISRVDAARRRRFCGVSGDI